MINFFSKFRIPTILGLGVILAGIIFGVILVIRDQNFIFLSKASPDKTPKDIILTNIEDSQATITFKTDAGLAAFLTYGISSYDEKNALDDRDNKLPNSHKFHYFTIKDLKADTAYKYQITSGGIKNDILKFETVSKINNQNNFPPVIGSALLDNQPVTDGIAYLQISNNPTQSALIKDGNFLIPITSLNITDQAVGKVTIKSSAGEANILFNIKSSDNLLPKIKIGENVDLTENPTPSPTPTEDDLKKYDLNDDGKINAADNAIILQNFGKNPKNIRADLNGDGVVDQKDLDLMAQKINQETSQ